MKALLLKFWKWFLEKNHALVTIVLLLLIGMGTTLYFQHLELVKYKDKYETEVKLKDALLDSMRIHKNEKNEWVAEKRTIQETIKNLEKMYGQLTESQKELIDRVKELNKQNTVITAALIETKVQIEGLVHHGDPVVDTVNKTINFSDSSRTDKGVVFYSMTATKVVPAFPNIKTGLIINNMYFPNKQMVEFHWLKNKKANYPVAFSVSNSNNYFKTINIESYALPGVKYEGSKFDQWLAKNGKMLKYLGIGTAVGGTTIWLLTK